MMDGSSFIEPQFDKFREAAKIVIYCLHRWPSMRAPLKAQSINEASIGVRYWMRWLAAAGCRSLAQVDRRAMAEFERYLTEDMLDENLDESLTASSIARYLRAPFDFGEESRRVEAAGLSPLRVRLRDDPKETPHTLARGLAKVALRRISPLPPEILLPLMNRAEWFMQEPAEDVTRLARYLVSEVPDILKAARDRATLAHMGRYISGRFQFLEGRGRLWHGSLAADHERIGSRELKPKTTSGIRLARDLIQDAMAAASIQLQGAAGLRVSEIEMLEASSLDLATGLPDCISIRYDDTGTIELFYLSGYLIKTTASRERAEWLIGSRIVGAKHLPPLVEAIRRLYQIAEVLDPDRTTKRLFLGSSAGAWEYFTGKVMPLDTMQIQQLQRAFAANYVDRALVNRIDLLRTHAWRKSFAQFVFSVDPSLGPALSQHFKHLRVAMTLEAYITNDPVLLGHLESATIMETARDIYEATTGRQAASGRFGKLIKKHQDEIRRLVAGRGEQEAIEAVYGFVEAHQITFWFLEWGDCGIAAAPTEAACHRVAGTVSFRNRAPNFAYRDLDICAGCSRLLILRRHLPFWRDRYSRLKASIAHLGPDVGSVARAALRKKLVQAKAVVRSLECPTTEADQKA
jgi:nucleoside diphosphate kinase